MWSNNRFDFNTNVVLGTKNAALTDDQLHKAAPSIFASEPWDEMTSKYQFVPTIVIVNKLRENGFMPVRAMQSRSRIEGKESYTKHMVVFRDVSRQKQVGDVTPEVVLVNSHDGTSSYQLHGGLFRLICKNGLIIADSTFAAIRCRHSKSLIDDIIEGTDTLIRELPGVERKVEEFKSIELTPPEQIILAEEALNLRYEGETHKPITPQQLIKSQRSEDAAPTLWNTYNRIEEHLVKGGVRGRNAKDGRTTTRAVNGVGQRVSLEKALWSLQEKMAQLKSQ